MPINSENLELGKAGEHYALYELIKQGFAAFLSDQGLAYDILVDVGGEVLRGQVKSTRGHADYGKTKNTLRFNTRSGKGTIRSAQIDKCDFYVFVSIADKLAIFKHVSEVESSKNKGFVQQCFDIRSNKAGYKSPKNNEAKVFAEDFGDFKRVIGVHNAKS